MTHITNEPPAASSWGLATLDPGARARALPDLFPQTRRSRDSRGAWTVWRIAVGWGVLWGVGMGPVAGLRAQVVVDRGPTLPPQSAAPGTADPQPFFSHGVRFNRTWAADFNCCPALGLQQRDRPGGNCWRAANLYSAYAAARRRWCRRFGQFRGRPAIPAGEKQRSCYLSGPECWECT